MEILTYCVAVKIDFARLEQQLHHYSNLILEKHGQVLELIDEAQEHYCYVFSNGTVIFWNVKRHQVEVYLQLIYKAAIKLLKVNIFDGYNYSLGDDTTIKPHNFYNVDCLVLESDDSDLKLGLSHGFSQSIKLKYFEDHIDQLSESLTPYIKQLSQQGSIKLSRAKARRIIGRILAVKAELNITSDFLYIPKFFWQHPSLESYFVMLQEYLDISERKNALDGKLESLNSIFYMFEGYLNERHSHNLEVIIIILIAIEILFSVLNLHL